MQAYEDMRIPEVREAIHAGALTAEEALNLERSRAAGPRVTLENWLLERVGDDPAPEPGLEDPVPTDADGVEAVPPPTSTPSAHGTATGKPRLALEPPAEDDGPSKPRTAHDPVVTVKEKVYVTFTPRGTVRTARRLLYPKGAQVRLSELMANAPHAKYQEQTRTGTAETK